MFLSIFVIHPICVYIFPDGILLIIEVIMKI